MNNLDSELLELGAIILAGVHMDTITYKCSECQLDPEIAEAMNCNMKPNHEPVFYHEDTGSLTTCPIRMIKADVYEYYDQYDYYMTFTGTAPSYNTVDTQFWKFVKTYKSYKNKYEAAKYNKDSSENRENKTQKNMAAMRGEWLNKGGK